MKSNPLNTRTTIEPRGLNREAAAFYIGVGTTKFDQLVAKGLMPAPKVIDSRKVWDRFELDTHFTALPDASQSDWDEVLGA